MADHDIGRVEALLFDVVEMRMPVGPGPGPTRATGRAEVVAFFAATGTSSTRLC